MRQVEMIKIGPSGEQLPADAANHVAVLLPAQGLMFTRRPVNKVAKSQTALEKECASADCGGFKDWTMPELDELEWIIDRSRYSPAMNKEFFSDVPNDWLWTKTGCAWQEKDTAGRSVSAWSVNASLGGVGSSHRYSGSGFALAVRRVGEFQGDVLSLHALYRAWKRARRQKAPSFNQLAFDLRWSSRLIELHEVLREGRWQPRPSTCFIAQRPKAREIHAPDFADRVVHHWLIPKLEAIYERIFIADSFANRKGKGSHAAVRRVQAFVRQVRSGQGRGYVLKLDVHNFFVSIHRPTLWAVLKRRMQRAGIPEVVQRAVHALLCRSPLAAGVRCRATAQEIALVPRHKRLECAPKDCGIPIGNLSSQFFANVYLNELDQFVKHTLGCKRYARYVDDFVLIHESREQLEQWRDQIIRFLHERLRLRLKDDQVLAPLDDGIDFLGYVIYPTHTRVRRRVVQHAREALAQWERTHVNGERLRVKPADLERVTAIWHSYEGHFAHANTRRLRHALLQRFPWLTAATQRRRFNSRTRHRTRTIHFARAAVRE